MQNQKVIETGGIPQCPHCQKPTRRTGGTGSITAAYYKPVYDENGHNTNPDRNTRTSHWQCLECMGTYSTAGNNTDGYYYKDLIGPSKPGGITM